MHHDVDGIVHGDDADHMVGVVDHRDGQQVVLGDEADRLVARRHLRHLHGPACGSGGEHAGYRVAGHEQTERHRVDERVRLGIDHEDGVDRLAGVLDEADMLKRLGDRPGRWHRDELGRHDRPCAACGIGEQLLEHAPRCRA